MFKIVLLQRLFLIFFLAGLFVACRSAEIERDNESLPVTTTLDEVAAAIPTPLPPATSIPTSFPTNAPMNTPTNTPMPTMTPTLAPTAPIWVAPGTPMAATGLVISANNADQLVELARWGRGVISDLDLSADGQWLAVAAGSGVYIHDVNQLSAPAIPIEVEANVTAVSLAPDGRQVALVTKTGTLAMWQVHPTQQIYERNAQVKQARFSPNGQLLLITTNEGVDLLWAETGEVINHYSAMLNGTFSPDSSELVVWDYGSAMRFNWQNNHLLSKFNPVTHMDAPDYWEGEIGLIITDLVFHERDLIIVAPQVNPNGFIGPVEIQREQDNLLLFGVAERIRLSEATSYVCNEPVFYWDPPEPAAPWHIEISPDGLIAGLRYQEAGFSDDYHNYTSLWFYRVADGQLLYNVIEGVVDFAILPDGERWITGLQDGRLQIRDLNTNAILESVDAYEAPLLHLEVSADNQWIGAEYLDKVKIYRREDGNVAYRYPATDVAFAPDGRSFALGYPDGRIELRDITSGELLQATEAHTEKITSLRYLPSGDLLSAGFDCQLAIWQMPEMQRINSLENVMVEGMVTDEPVPMRVREFLLMPDSQTVIGLFWGGEFAVWSLPDGLLLREPEWENRLFVLDVSADGRYLAMNGGYHSELWDGSLTILDSKARVAGFSPDATLLAGSEWGWMENRSLEGALRLWETSSMTMLHMMKPQTDTMLTIAFTTDGQFIVSSGLDGIIRLWGTPK